MQSNQSIEWYRKEHLLRHKNKQANMASLQKKSDALLEEEAIIKKRFLTQTAVATSSGGGPPFRKLVESYKAFCGSEPSSDDRTKGLDTLLSDLYSIYSYINKLEIMMGVYQKEQSLYHGRNEDLLVSIEKAGLEIQARKLELEQARREMEQAIECEGVKEQIVKIPARSATLREIDAVKKEIEELQSQRQVLDQVTSARISQFRTILDTIEQVEGDIGGDAKGEEDCDDEMNM